MRRLAIVLALPLALISAARAAGDGQDVALDAFDWRKRSAVRVQLPVRLREISGLAVTADGRVFAHGDERGVVVELDIARGAIVKAFALGSPPVIGDFEGIAIADERIFLVTSTGRLYETREGADGATVPFTVHRTDFGAQCELEGLAYDPSDRSLIIGCKQPRNRALRGSVTLFRWSIDRRASAASPRITTPVAALVGSVKAKGFNLSSVEREPSTGHYVMVAGPQRLVAEVTPNGAVVAVRELPRELHAQPEGIAFLGDSGVLIADEGGTRRATLTRYPRVDHAPPEGRSR